MLGYVLGSAVVVLSVLSGGPELASVAHAQHDFVFDATRHPGQVVERYRRTWEQLATWQLRLRSEPPDAFTLATVGADGRP